MTAPKTLLGGLVAIAGLACGGAPASAQDSPNAIEIVVRWYDTKPDDALINPWIFLGFHNGQFNSYDFGKPLPPFTEFWLRKAFAPPLDMVQAFKNNHPGTEATRILNPGTHVGQPLPAPVPFTINVTLDPQRHRFLSFLMPLFPSDDALIGNEDPFEIELFDSTGKFKGPMYLDVYGNQVVDAGLCANDEEQLLGLDYHDQPDLHPPCTPGEGVAQPHPGLNGSYRNPDALPQRILGGSTLGIPPGGFGYRYYDPINADFSLPGYKIGRMLITRRWASGESSGSYYSPERAGEGFNIEIIEPEPGQARRRILVYWYTFKPDGSGEQVWLAGMGEMGADGGVAADVEMYITTGGEFASTSNPDLVDRERWGTIRIGFGACGQGRVFYQPDDTDWPSGDYLIHRLSPQIEGLGWVCAPPDAARLVLPED